MKIERLDGCDGMVVSNVENLQFLNGLSDASEGEMVKSLLFKPCEMFGEPDQVGRIFVTQTIFA